MDHWSQKGYRVKCKSSCLLRCLLALAVSGVVCADTATLSPSTIEAAISDTRRPDEQVKLDQSRRPAISVVFAEVKAGDRVADVMSGNAYFTRILSDVVGPSGRVFAYLPTEQIAHCSPNEIAGTQAIARDISYKNVTLLTGSLAELQLPEQLDVVWMSQSYHDLHDAFLGPVDAAVVNKAIFDALKPGGVFLVIDHVAEAGSGLRDTETLHRIDPIQMQAEIEAAGFKLESHSDALRNPGDDHRRAIFDSTIRGSTDQVLLRFRKPK